MARKERVQSRYMPLCWAWSCVPNVDRVPTGIGCVYVAEWGRYQMTLFAANAVRLGRTRKDTRLRRTHTTGSRTRAMGTYPGVTVTFWEEATVRGHHPHAAPRRPQSTPVGNDSEQPTQSDRVAHEGRQSSCRTLGNTRRAAETEPLRHDGARPVADSASRAGRFPQGCCTWRRRLCASDVGGAARCDVA